MIRFLERNVFLFIAVKKLVLNLFETFEKCGLGRLRTVTLSRAIGSILGFVLLTGSAMAQCTSGDLYVTIGGTASGVTYTSITKAVTSLVRGPLLFF